MTAIVQTSCSCDKIALDADPISVDQACQLAIDLVKPIAASELVSLNDALGRVSAKDLCAPRAMPFFDNSAMDGYAVCVKNFEGDGPFIVPVCGECAAGDDPAGLKSSLFEYNFALRIFTGAPVPAGFDAVIAQENCTIKGDKIKFNEKPPIGCNIRSQGSDIARGLCLLKAGQAIRPHHIGLLAANGYSAINVTGKPKIAVFSTGDELVSPGSEPVAGEIYDCNKPMLKALFAQMGIEVIDLGVLPDSLQATQKLFADCRDQYELIISTGSVSVGDRDFLKSAFSSMGGRINNWKVAVKPGKPVLFGQLGNTILTGLPGNPFAVFVGFHLFVKPQLLRLMGSKQAVAAWLPAIANFSWKRKPGRAEIFPVRASLTEDDRLTVDRLGNSVSATLYPMMEADGLGILPAGCDEVEPGDVIMWQNIQ